MLILDIDIGHLLIWCAISLFWLMTPSGAKPIIYDEDTLADVDDDIIRRDQV